MQLLQAADALAAANVLFNNQDKRNAANEVFTAINEAGDI